MSDVIRTAAFDGLAERYDAHFTATALGTVLRKMSWRRFERAFAGREYLLDIGCGTGEDAIHFAKLGHRVVATDASLQMVRMATRKAVIVPNTDHGCPFPADDMRRHGIRSLMHLPLIANEEPIGVIMLAGYLLFVGERAERPKPADDTLLGELLNQETWRHGR